jgi:hypothetical protein
MLKNVGARLGVVWNRTEISSHLNLEEAEEGTWRTRAVLIA